MDIVIFLIFLFIIIIVGSLFIKLLPYLLIAYFVIWIIRWITTKTSGNNDSYYDNTQSNDTYTTPKNEAIDVEYTEREDNDQN